MHTTDQALDVQQPPQADPALAYTTQASAALRYRTEQILNLSPVEVIRKLYDLAILGCKKGDLALSQKALTELIGALDFSQGEIALKLFGLYDYCKRGLRKGATEEVLDVLQQLRAAWIEAFHL